MSFPAYPKYRDSGIEWLGDVPEGWETNQLRRNTIEHRQGYYSSESYAESGVKLLRITDLRQHGELDWSYCPRVKCSSDIEPFKLLLNDFVFARTGGAGTFAVVPEIPEPIIYASYLIRFRFSKKLRSDYLVMFFQSHLFQQSIKKKIHGGVNQNVHAEDIKDQYLPVPPIPEQRAIASFLDSETSKIDALVAEQRRLIELLKEKRQAVISHAVTKGLNPNAKMKPSGIEWLGDVPEEWEVLPIKHAIRSIEQGWSPQCENDPVQSEEAWGVLKVGCVNYGQFAPTENKALPTDLTPREELGIKRGDLLISRANTTELVGSAAVAEADYDRLMLCDKLYRLRMLVSQLSPGFLCYFLTSDLARKQIELGASGASPSMKNISQSVITELRIGKPSVEEQREITRGITERVAELNTLTAEAQRAIELLRERRTALISAAVTGKIDVRNCETKRATV